MAIQGTKKIPNVKQYPGGSNAGYRPAQGSLNMWAQQNQSPSRRKFSDKSYYDRIGYTPPEEQTLARQFNNLKNRRGTFFDLENLEPTEADRFSQMHNPDMGNLNRALVQMGNHTRVKPPGGFDSDSLTDPPPPEEGFFSKFGDWVGGHPLDAAKVGLGLWRGIQQNRALDQQDEYLTDVRKSMAFDQEDVNRRWNLAMGDYRVREEDQNQYRTAQGMANTKTNFTV